MSDHRLRIYIVEDNPTLGSLEAHIFNNEPHYEANWELLDLDTFARVQQKRPNLIIVEVPPIRLPKATPYVEFLDRLAADPQIAPIAVVVIATDGATADRLSSHPAVDAMLAKPYDVEALLNIVADTLLPPDAVP